MKESAEFSAFLFLDAWCCHRSSDPDSRRSVANDSGAPPLVAPLFMIASRGRTAAGIEVPVVRDEIHGGRAERIRRTDERSQRVAAQISQIDESKCAVSE